jgi:hypothetical protein
VFEFIELALTLFFKRQQHRKLSWLDKDSDKDQSQFDELFSWTPVIIKTENYVVKCLQMLCVFHVRVGAWRSQNATQYSISMSNWVW